jgi:UDP-glucose 4-epimerase
MQNIVDRPIRIHYLESSKGDARDTSADVSKAQKILGYQAQVYLREGLRQEWEWVQSLYG